jgi:RecA/RadA recombinase
MAKKKGKEFTFSEVGNLIEDSIKSTSILVDDGSEASKREYLKTGIYLLNALFSKSILNGGIQSNRITAIAGDSGCLVGEEQINIYVMKTKKMEHDIFDSRKI